MRSIPTIEMNTMRLTPARAAATAWLAPLPPTEEASVVASTVSPGVGQWPTTTVWSRLIEPSTTSGVVMVRPYPAGPWRP